jgi:hypothetical protein
MNDMKPIAPVRAARLPNRGAAIMKARVWHSYSGAFFAPAILFFSITGAFQTFNLHKPAPGYHPPAVLQALASMHKNQNLKVKYVDMGAAEPAKPDKPDAAARARLPFSAAAQILLKVFTALVSVGLAVTTMLGLYMSWATTRRRAVLLWFAAGLVLPILVMLAI